MLQLLPLLGVAGDCRPLPLVAGKAGLYRPFTGLLPAGSLYSTFATCYMKLAGDDLDLGPSFQQHMDKAYQEQHHAALFKQPTAAEVSAMPKLHLNHPDIRDNGLYQVKQQALGGACC